MDHPAGAPSVKVSLPEASEADVTVITAVPQPLN